MQQKENEAKVKVSRSRRRIYEEAPNDENKTSTAKSTTPPPIEPENEPELVEVEEVETDAFDIAAAKAEVSDDADKLIRRYMFVAGGIGILPSTILDIASLIGAQIAMVAELASLYGIPYDKIRNQPVLVSAISALITQGVLKTKFVLAVRMIPVVGSLTSFLLYPAMASSITYAVGKVFKSHFEEGHSLTEFRAEAFRDMFDRKMKEASSAV